MISIDAVRVAMLSDMPWSRLDEIVRAEMSAGRKIKEIFGDLNAMLDDVRDTPGLSEDGDDAILDTLDALTGNCRADQCYQDPPNTTLPAEEEIATLPRWGRVAFAARCARRVLPLFLHKWPDAPQSYVAQLTWAVEVSEKSAARSGAGEVWVPPAGAITCLAYVCDAGINADRNRARAVEVIVATGVAITKFKDRAENIFDPHLSAVVAVITHNASVALANGMATSQETYGSAVMVADAVIRRDFDHLVNLSDRGQWTDETPVPLEVFGPLWPEGIPEGWPVAPVTAAFEVWKPLVSGRVPKGWPVAPVTTEV